MRPPRSLAVRTHHDEDAPRSGALPAGPVDGFASPRLQCAPEEAANAVRSGRNTMTPIHSRLLKIMLPLAAVAGFAATPALAQKKGGTLTVGVELDIAGFDPLKVGVYDTSPNIAASLFLEQLTRLGEDGKPKPSLALSWSAFRRLQDLDLQAQARREVLGRHAVQRPGRGLQLRPPEGPQEQLPLRLLHRQHAERRSQGRPDRRLHAQGSGGEPPRAADAARPEQHDPFADGDPGQGRRLQPQSRRHRALRHQVMDGRRPHGAGAQPQLLEQGQAQPRPRRAAAAARRPVALRQPRVGRDRRGVGRRVRGRQHRPRAQEQRAAGARLCRLGRRRRRHQHQGAAARRRARAPGAGHGARSQEGYRRRSPTAWHGRRPTPTARAHGSSARTTARCRTIPRRPPS